MSDNRTGPAGHVTDADDVPGGPGLPEDLKTDPLITSITRVYLDMTNSLTSAVITLINLHVQLAYQRGRADAYAAADTAPTDGAGCECLPEDSERVRWGRPAQHIPLRATLGG